MIRRTATGTDGFMLRYAAMQDSALSYRARGVLAAVLSHSATWRVDAEWLASQGKEGRQAILPALRELQARGYLSRTRIRDPRGRLRTVWEISDSPGSGFGTPVNRTAVTRPAGDGMSADRTPVDGSLVTRTPGEGTPENRPSSLGESMQGVTPPPAPARRSPSPEVEALVGVVRRALPRTTPPPGLPTLRRACADAVDAGWTPAAMDRAIRGHDWTGARSGAVVALVRALAEEGPTAAPTDAQDRPDWCGRCDETTRMLTDPETGAQARCGRCHPLAGTVPASVARRLREAEEEAAMRRLHLVPSPRGDG